MEKNDFSELHQFFNDISSSIGDVAKGTSNALFEVRAELSNLSQNLSTTNNLLIILIVINTVAVIFNIVQKRKK
ncbi:hypothetical protein [Paenibacillus apiarius]|uniref:hypothetical protein n=1 Tax=Paenibacillus apiarius TaxID=46240 RepID=UPI001981A162|nr:hypothetical protein [Paenibacillus apiarius]MBN3523996.1 hypothetical protein [Paenibacillus apiarius]